MQIPVNERKLYYLGNTISQNIIFDYAKTLTGGHFEASNNPDFSDPDTIHTISHWLLSADSFEIKPQKHIAIGAMYQQKTRVVI